MKMKNLSLILFSLIAVLAIANFAAAATSFSVSTTSLTFIQNSGSQTLSVTPTNSSAYTNINLDNVQIALENGDFAIVTLNQTSLNNINSTAYVKITPTSNYNNMKNGKVYSGNILIKNALNNSDNQTVTINLVKSYCSSGDIGTNLTISDVSIDNADGDDEEWMPLDKISVEVEVQNNNEDEDDKIDTYVALELYDNTGKEYLKLSKIKLGKIAGDDGTKIATFSFKAPADLAISGGSSYYLYIKAYKNGNENTLCTSKVDSTSYYKVIKVDREDEDSRQVVADDIVAEPYPASCTEEVTIKAKIYNVGDSDQEKVKITLYNKELGIDAYQVLNNLDQGKNKLVEFKVAIPKNATEKVYKFDIRTMYDYDDDYKAEDNAAYDEYSDTFSSDLKVEGNCIKIVTNKASITSTSLQTDEADIKAGNEVIIKATIKNTGESETSYVVSTTGTDSFGTVSKIDPSTFTLKAGESKDVLLTLKLNKDASGEQIFSIKATYNGGEATQSVSLIVPESAGLFSGLSFGESLKSNWFIWVIVIINIILIIAVIIVAVKMVRA